MNFLVHQQKRDRHLSADKLAPTNSLTGFRQMRADKITLSTNCGQPSDCVDPLTSCRRYGRPRIIDQESGTCTPDVNNPRPHSVKDIILPDTMKVTTCSENFLLWDSGDQDTNRMFMFGTATNLQLFEQYPHWFVDRTFKIAPKIFLQVFTIYALIDNRSIPLIYVLMGKKLQADYERVFQKALELRPSLTPISIKIDFERGSMKSTVFPNATVLGCLFHIGQSLWRRIQTKIYLICITMTRTLNCI